MKDNFESDYIKEVRKKRREEEIKKHNKPIKYLDKPHSLKKKYKRTKFKYDEY